MPTPPENIQLLAQKLLQGTITPAEKKLLDDWYDQQLPTQVNWTSDADETALKNRLFAAIREQSRAEITPLVRWRSRFVGWAAAAVLLLVAGAGLYLFQQPPPVVKQKAVAKAVTPAIIPPGGNKAVLTLGDGSNIILDHSDNGQLALEGGVVVSKTKDGELRYEAGNVANNTPAQLNTLRTPNGGQYRLELPDGSIVWLNAASSLRFPATFDKRERLVQLTGEAYFEIAKDSKRPFSVQLDHNTRVQVLGTHFNVMAYPDEGSINTTLLEGSVQVAHHTATRTIRPGQQAVVREDIRVSAVNAEEVIAWQRGDFQFDNADFAGILRQLERWYNVDFLYEKLPDVKLKGIVSRSYNLSQVLKMIELTSSVRFKTEGRTVRVVGGAQG